VKAERTNGEEGVGAAVGRAIFGRKIPGSAPEKMTLACADKVNQGPEEREPMKLEIKRRQERSQDASMEPPQLACGGNQHDQSAIQPHLGALHQGGVGAETLNAKKRGRSRTRICGVNRFSPIVSIP
jgi:hypothetical protein